MGMRGTLTAGLLAMAAVTGPAAGQARAQTLAEPMLGGLPAPAADRDLSALPLLFEANHGQWPAGVAYGARAANGLLLEARRGAPLVRLGARSLRLTLDGARRDVAPVAEAPQRAVVNLFHGNDPSRWVRGARTFGAVRYPALRPGVDLVLHGDGRSLEYDFDVAPGVDVGDIAVHLRGARRLRIDRRGDLLASVGGETLRQRRPVAFQGSRRIPARFVLRGDGRVRFRVGDYDRAQPLTIDPTLIYASYLGGTGDEVDNDVAVDASGASYLFGDSGSYSVATAQRTSGDLDTVIAKIDADGHLEYATFLGGPSLDSAGGIAVEISTKRVVVTGKVEGCGFPIAGAPFDPSCAGFEEGWVARLSATGALTESTYIGGDASDDVTDVARAPGGDWIVVGETVSSTGFPTAGTATAYAGNRDYFVARLPGNLGGEATYSRFFGGGSTEGANGPGTDAQVAVDGPGNAYVSGITGSTGMGFGPGADTTPAGVDALVARFSPTGTREWSTYLGTTTTPGFGAESAAGIVVTANGKLLVAGTAPPPGFLPAGALTGAFQPAHGGALDGYVARMPLDRPVLEAASYLGGVESDMITAVAGSAASDWVVAGSTASDDFPTTRGAYDTTAGAEEAFVTALDPDGAALRYSTRLPIPEYPRGLTLLGQVAHVLLSTEVAGFPVTDNAYDATANGQQDMVLVRLDWRPPETTITPLQGTPTNDSTPSFSLGSDDPAATFQCHLGGVVYSSCPAAYTTGELSDGQYTLTARAIDHPASNADPTPATLTFRVDTVAPNAQITSGPDGPTNDSTPSFGFSSLDGTASFECRVDATGAWAPCSPGFTVSPALRDGAHAFYVRARDPAGNVQPVPAQREFTVDTDPPETTAIGPSGPTADNTPTIGLTADESPVSFRCAVDGISRLCGASQTLGPLADGPHSFTARASDAAGNVDPTPATLSFTVDTTAPETEITGGPPTLGNDDTPAFTFTSTEPRSSFTCRLDGTLLPWCASGAALAEVDDGRHTFSVAATDAVGNLDGTPATRTFTVDTAPPDTAIASGPDGVTSDRRPSFSISSPDPGATLACTLGGAPTPCSGTFTPDGDLVDGPYTLTVVATDAAGNPDPTPATRSFIVEATSPDTALTGPTLTNDPQPDFALAATETATFECTLDDAPATACAAEYSPPSPLSDGPHQLRGTAIDAAGNRDPEPASLSFVVDTAAPDTRIVSGPSSVTAESRPSFEFESENDATYACAVDLGAFEACTSPYRPAAALADGSHVFSVRATDAAGNTDPTSATRSFTVVTTMPPPPPPPNDFETLDATDLALACDKRRIVLIDVVPSGRGKVAITGGAQRATFAGKTVEVLLDGRRVATTTVGADGAIATTVKAPPAKRAAKARYRLRAAADSSADVKLNRRTLVTSIAVTGDKVVIRGLITKPLPRKPKTIVFRRQTSCTDYEVVGRVRPGRSGRYTARLPLPPAPVKAAIYRGETKVTERAGRPAQTRSFTLARAVNVR